MVGLGLEPVFLARNLTFKTYKQTSKEETLSNEEDYRTVDRDIKDLSGDST